MILNEFSQESFITLFIESGFNTLDEDRPWSMDHHIINKRKETPEIPPNNSPQDIINEIFENVPVSLGKQHFSPKPEIKIIRIDSYRYSYTVYGSLCTLGEIQ